MKVALVMEPDLVGPVFGVDGLARIAELVDLWSPEAVTDLERIPTSVRQHVEVVVAGWGMPELGLSELELLPNLKAVVHWAGGGGVLTSEAVARGVVLSSGRASNAIPVAEWTVAMMVLAAKDAFWLSRSYCAAPGPIDRISTMPDAGLYGTTVGIVGASSVGIIVMEMLKSYDVDVLLYDPYATPSSAAALGAELVDDLEELARRCRILSIHAPVTTSTVGMISRGVLAAMPDGAVLINTSRGVIVDQEALTTELASGRIRAVLDVTEPEILTAGHPLYTLPNVFVTPHLAGSLGLELRRLGDVAISELENYLAGRPFSDTLN